MSWFTRDWTQIRHDTFGGRVLRMPLALLPRQRPLRILSGPCKGMKWVLGSNIYSCWFGTYEIEKQTALSRFLRPGMTVYDIGANAGFYTLLFAKSVGLKGHVYSFEPFPENSFHLIRHVELNGLQNVAVIQAAISDNERIASFQVGESNSSGSVTSESGVLNVPTLSLDHLIQQGYPLPDLIKMDIEGGESSALQGALDLLSKARTICFIALHHDQARKECGEILRTARYQLFLLNGKDLNEIPPGTDEIYALPPNFKQ